MRRWWLRWGTLIALLLSLGVNLGLVAAVAMRRIASRPGLQRLEGEPLPRFRRLADRLGLEGEQRRRFFDLQRQLFEETVRIRMRQAESQREVRRELVSREPDQERIDALLQQAARDFLALEQALAKNIAATRAILSPAQEEEYLRIVSRMQQQPPRRRLPPMRERRFPRERGEIPEEGPPL
ncbi:MAG TPA: periplasmic heavy metal sensor [Thermoanaerobaculia bacterium]|nr:periplasmic heavy metal sensor [Thermoanaerobaculia bacterium]